MFVWNDGQFKENSVQRKNKSFFYSFKDCFKIEIKYRWFECRNCHSTLLLGSSTNPQHPTQTPEASPKNFLSQNAYLSLYRSVSLYEPYSVCCTFAQEALRVWPKECAGVPLYPLIDGLSRSVGNGLLFITR